MVKSSVIVGIFHSQSRIVGSDETPDFTADGTAFGADEKFIVPSTGERRINTMFKVVDKNTVFTAGVKTSFLPEFSQLTGSRSNADFLQCFEPDDLNIQVIIGVELFGPEIVIICFVELFVTFIGRTDNAAERFSDPSAENAVVISLIIKSFFHFQILSITFFYLHNIAHFFKK